MQINLRGHLLSAPAAPKGVLLEDTRLVYIVCGCVCRATAGQCLPGGELPGDTVEGEWGGAHRPFFRTLLLPKRE